MRSSLRSAARLLPVWVALAFTGCIHRTEPVKLPTQQPVAVAFVQDSEMGDEVTDAPQAVKDAIAAALAARNLQAQVVDPKKVTEAFAFVRASERRLAWLQETTETPYVLLVETRARFFSQLSGRYRWVVLAKLTAQERSSKAAPTTRDFEEGVVLQFDHQRAAEALEVAAPRIGEAAGGLFDDLLVIPTTETSPASAQKLPQPGAIYFVMVDRFANGDPSNDGVVDPKDPAAFHGGDLQGVIDHLDDLKALGVETVWLSPVFKMRTEKFFGFGAFHGYWVYDLNQVEPRFGDRRLLRRLSDELHARGMKLLLDVVLNHVGPDAPLMTQKPAWFHHQGALEHWDDPVEVQTHDVFGLPDLAQENPEVYAYLLNASLKWILEVKPDGFRLDAVKHMPVAFWRRYTADVRKAAGDDFLLLGEMLEGDPQLLARTWRDGGFDAVFDFPLKYAVEDVFCKGQPLTHLAAALSLDRLYEDPSRLVTLADNHDLPRIVSACGGDLEKVKQVLTVTLTARGTPSLTWGTEAALAGAKEPENRGNMRFDAQPLREHIARLLALRRKHPALVWGVTMPLVVSADQLVEVRVGEDEAAIVAINRGASPMNFDVPSELEYATWRNALTGETISGSLTVPAHATALALGNARAVRAFDDARATASPMGTGRGAPVQVRFRVSASELKPGTVLRIIGSAPELGGWNVEKAPKIGPDGALELSLPRGVYEYKLVRTGPGGSAEWETVPNRALFIDAGASGIDVTLTWNGDPKVVRWTEEVIG